MVAKTPGQLAGIERLKRWGASPTGGGKIINWGVPGDFARCEAFYKDKVPGRMLKGWCAELHKLATGGSPGHAPGVEQADAAAKHLAALAKKAGKKK